jgi:hypothetical protein
VATKQTENNIERGLKMTRDLPIIPLLGYNETEKHAVLTALETLKNANYKFGVLLFDDDFKLLLYNMTKAEERTVIKQIKDVYKSIGGE